MTELQGLVKISQSLIPLATVVLPLNPVPASRPRVPRFGKPYYLKTYNDWKVWLEGNLEQGDIYEQGTISVVVTHIIKKARTSKLLIPKGDIDNYDKAAFDAITEAGGYWMDDKQIEHSFSTKRFCNPDEEPRTIVEIYKR